MPTVTRDCNKGLTGISVHQFTEYKHSETHKLSRAVYVYETRAVAFLMRSQTRSLGSSTAYYIAQHAGMCTRGGGLGQALASFRAGGVF